MILRCFFLRKEFIRIKNGEKTCGDLKFYFEEVISMGRSYGSLDMLEALNRHTEYNQSVERGVKTHKVFSLPIVDSIDNTLIIARRFRPNKRSSRQDALGRILEEIVKNYYIENRRLPEYTDVIKCLKKLAISGHEVIIKVNPSQIHWSREKGKLPEKVLTGALQERLTRIRKKYKSKR